MKPGRAFLALLGFTGGASVGIGLIAVYSLFDFLSVLRGDSTDKRFDRAFEIYLLIGSLLSTGLYFSKISFVIPGAVADVIAVFFGISVGLLAASLSDVTGIIPVLKQKMPTISLSLIAACMTIGRLAGSIYFFITKI